MGVRFASILFMLLLVVSSQATHIVGGVMYYDHLGGDQYRITLELYRDCSPANTNNQGFDANAPIGIFTSTGSYLFTETISFPGQDNVPVVINNPCLSAPPDVCVSTASYKKVITLPPIPGGYILAYQRCCRTPTIVNLQGAANQGLTCTVSIPGPDIAPSGNSAPRFNNYPPVVLCMGDTTIIDHSAMDPDGDDLVYELYTPFHGASNVAPSPNQPSAPPYQPVTWGAGYSAEQPIDSDPPITLDPVTGQIILTPSMIGSFAVGVKVKEYRNGVLLSEVIRDFNFFVVACETAIVSTIQEQDADGHCSGLTVNFTNESSNATFWHWDFGDPLTDADTSSLADPTYTYPQGGSYVVTLIANPGWPCADTNQTVFHTTQLIDAYFVVPPVLCPDEVTVLSAVGSIPPNSNYTWDVPPSAVVESTTAAALPLKFTTLGIHPVTLTISVGDCFGTFTDSLTVHPYPEAWFSSDTEGCIGNEFAFQDSSIIAGSVMYKWDLGDGTTSAIANPKHIYTEAGTYTVSLVVQQWQGCVGSDTLVLKDHVHVYPLPVAGFELSPPTVSVVQPEILFVDRSTDASTWEYFVEDLIYDESDPVHSFQGDGLVPVWQTVMSGNGCRDSTMREAYVIDHLFFAPNSFTPDGDGINDTFAPVVVGARLYEIVIYDRYGAEVFRSRDPHEEWTGDDRPAGVYTFTAHIAEHGTHRQAYTGHITLFK